MQDHADFPLKKQYMLSEGINGIYTETLGQLKNRFRQLAMDKIVKNGLQSEHYESNEASFKLHIPKILQNARFYATQVFRSQNI